MEQITITLPDDVATQLRTLTKNSGIQPEDFLLASLQEKLAQLDTEFINAMKYVIKKNTELYNLASGKRRSDITGELKKYADK